MIYAGGYVFIAEFTYPEQIQINSTDIESDVINRA